MTKIIISTTNAKITATLMPIITQTIVCSVSPYHQIELRSNQNSRKVL
jgi:hypothetical protein